MAEINYISEMNSFEQWLESNYLPASAQLLWYKLFHLFNRCGWMEWISIDNLRLMSKIEVKREATFFEVRKSLVDANLIKYQKGRKGVPGKYKMLYLSLQSEKQYSTNSVCDSVCNDVGNSVCNNVCNAVGDAVGNAVCNTVDITKRKQNKTKQLKKIDKKEIDPFVEFAGENAKLLEALIDFEKMRVKIKKPLTDKAKQLLVGKLRDISNDENVLIQALSNSVLYNWQGVFAPKENAVKATKGAETKPSRFDFDEHKKRSLEQIKSNAEG